MTQNERNEVLMEMYKHIPAKTADDLRAVAGGIFTLCRDTEGMETDELISMLALMNGMATGVLMTAADMLDANEAD